MGKKKTEAPARQVIWKGEMAGCRLERNSGKRDTSINKGEGSEKKGQGRKTKRKKRGHWGPLSGEGKR